MNERTTLIVEERPDADGNQWHLIAFSFEAEVIGGELGLSDETSEAGYYAISDLQAIDLCLAWEGAWGRRAGCWSQSWG